MTFKKSHSTARTEKRIKGKKHENLNEQEIKKRKRKSLKLAKFEGSVNIFKLFFKSKQIWVYISTFNAFFFWLNNFNFWINFFNLLLNMYSSSNKVLKRDLLLRPVSKQVIKKKKNGNTKTTEYNDVCSSKLKEQVIQNTRKHTSAS